MDNKYDIVIIGSGLGGLLCANILGKKGYKVTVVEKNAIPGGCLQTFKRKRVIFDTGIHYVGSLGEGQSLYQLFKYLGLLSALDLRPLDPNGFDRFILGEKEFSYATGHEQFVETLSESFPAHHSTIQKFSDKVREVSDSVPLYNLRKTKVFDQSFFEKLSHGSTLEYLQKLTPDTEMQNVLSALNTLYAGEKEGSLMFVHSLIYNHYIEGAYRFVNGSHHLTEQLIKQLKSYGGELITSEEAVAFDFDDKKINKLVCKSGNEYRGDIFISAIHPQATLSWVPEDKVRRVFRNRINSIPNTTSAFTIYLVLKDKKVPYMNNNMYINPSGDVWSPLENMEKNWPKACAVFPVADNLDQEYTRGVSVFTFMSYEVFKQWEHTKVEARGRDYDELKDMYARKVINFLKAYMPELVDNIESYYASTPLTYRDYMGTPEGAIYGIERDYRKPLESFIFPRTKIPNLLFTGQNVMLHGMMGVSMGALLTCGELVDVNSLIEEINNA